MAHVQAAARGDRSDDAIRFGFGVLRPLIPPEAISVVSAGTCALGCRTHDAEDPLAKRGVVVDHILLRRAPVQGSGWWRSRRARGFPRLRMVVRWQWVRARLRTDDSQRDGPAAKGQL